ncbi:MAG TPA: hypothetical protein VHC86_05695 [Opitutaceae bacterium]|nr:hypothetical protein [Opitutaceae bacterium]
MSNPAAPAPRSVSLVTIAAIGIAFALFYFLIRLVHVSHPPAYIPETEVAEKLGSDQQWQATPAARLAYLQQLRAQHEKQLASYGWVDQKSGVVQLPIDRAMELVIRDYGAKKP